MRNFMNGLMLVAAGALVAGTSYAADAVKADNVSPMKKMFPNAYGSLKLRHDNFYTMQGDDVTGQSTKLMVRPTIGSTWFSGNLNTYVALPFYKDLNESETTKGQPYLYADYDGYSNDLVSVTPYILHYFPSKASGDGGSNAEPITVLAVTNSIGHNVTTAVGSVSFGGYFELYTYNYTNGSTTEVKNSKDVDAKTFSLTGDESNETDETDPFLGTEYSANIGFRPDSAKKLKVSMHAFVYRDFTPTYIANEENGNVEFDGYAAANTSRNLYLLSYSMNDHVTLSNELYQYFGGVYESRKIGTRWKNYFSVSSKLF